MNESDSQAIFIFIQSKINTEHTIQQTLTMIIYHSIFFTSET